MEEKDRGRMRQEDYFIVRKFHVEIINEIDPRFLIHQLFACFLFDEEDMERVRAEQERHGRTAGAVKIMEILYHSGATAFPKFLETLHKAGYGRLATRLEEGQQIQQGQAVQEEHTITE